MEPRVSGAQKFFVVLFTLLAVVSGIPALFVLPGRLVLMRPDEYQRGLVASGFYRRYPQLLAGVLKPEDALPGAQMQNALAFLDEQDYQQVFAAVFPAVWLEAQGGSVLSQFWDYLNAGDGELHLMVDMRPVQSSMQGEGARLLAQQMLQSWPACTQQELLQLGALALGGGVQPGMQQDVPLCRPPAPLVSVAEERMTQTIAAFGGQMPGEIDLAQSLPQQSAQWQQMVYRYRAIRQLDFFLPAAALLFLFLVALLTLPSLRRLFNWWALVLILSGVGALSLALVLYISQNVLLAGLAQSLTGSGAALIEVWIQAGEYVVGVFLLGAGASGAGAALIGAGLYVAGRFMPR